MHLHEDVLKFLSPQPLSNGSQRPSIQRMISELFYLIKTLQINPTPGPGRCSARERGAARLLLAGLTASSSVISRLKAKTGVEDLIRSLPTDLSLDGAVAKASKLECSPPEALHVLHYEMSVGGCFDHNALEALPLSLWRDLAKHLKSYIAPHKLELTTASCQIPPEVIMDLCRDFICVIVNTQGDPSVLGLDICSATSNNLLVDFSLSSLASADTYYSHGAPHPPGSIVYGPNDRSACASPCKTIIQVCLTINGVVRALSACSCGPVREDICPFVVPTIDKLIPCVFENIQNILETMDIHIYGL